MVSEALKSFLRSLCRSDFNAVGMPYRRRLTVVNEVEMQVSRMYLKYVYSRLFMKKK